MAALAASAAPRSPATSPRLPSPPPFPEVQLPPASPGMPTTEPAQNPPTSPHSPRRIRPGTRAADMQSGPQLVPLTELDSAFQLQEHLKALHASHTHSPNDPSSTQPITATTALEITAPPPSIDRSLWLYELTRFLVMRANDLLVSFFRETPPCSAATCPEMRASEWQYLCAVHEPPKPCCAIDYSCHTLDWAAYVLTSQKTFPSRLTLKEGQGGERALTNIMRRVYRIFAHAWFSHRDTFWEVEGREGLYCLFKTVCDYYDLIPKDNYTIPKEAEGGGEEEKGKDESFVRRMGSPEKKAKEEEGGANQPSTATALRRHRTTPSVGSSVATIQEGDEEDMKDANNSVAGLADRMSKSMLGEGPLATISKTAEKIEVPPLSPEKGKEATTEGAGSTPHDVKEESPRDAREADSTEETARASSPAPDATTVKVEEKSAEDE